MPSMSTKAALSESVLRGVTSDIPVRTPLMKSSESHARFVGWLVDQSALPERHLAVGQSCCRVEKHLHESCGSQLVIVRPYYPTRWHFVVGANHADAKRKLLAERNRAGSSKDPHDLYVDRCRRGCAGHRGHCQRFDLNVPVCCALCSQIM